jgi:small subunit ribosomal protein S6
MKYNVGHYFVMRFDSNAAAQQLVRRTLGLEPRLLRFNVVKLGKNLKDISEVGGKAEEWSGFVGSEGRIGGQGSFA